LENRSFVDQKLHAVWALLAAQPEIFSRQGTVRVSWRSHQGRQLGPYFRLVYRERDRQRALYLGSCAELAAQVRDALQVLQAPRRRQRAWQVLWKKGCAALRQHKQEWDAELRKLGLYLKGYEIRGYRRARGL
jgi:hypothetical protein